MIIYFYLEKKNCKFKINFELKYIKKTEPSREGSVFEVLAECCVISAYGVFFWLPAVNIERTA